jgi:thiamine transporter ThiT
MSTPAKAIGILLLLGIVLWVEFAWNPAHKSAWSLTADRFTKIPLFILVVLVLIWNFMRRNRREDK